MIEPGGADIRREAKNQVEENPECDPVHRNGPVLGDELGDLPRPAYPEELVEQSRDAASESEWKAMTALRLAGEALALPDIRLDKIAIVQSALANGSYRVQTSKLASKVIDSMVDSMMHGTTRPSNKG